MTLPNRSLTILAATLAALQLSTSALAQKPATFTPVALDVTVEATTTDFSDCAICSDGQGVYSDGVDGVTANFDKYGNLIINFQTTRTPFRKLTYKYADPVDGQSAVSPAGNYMSTLQTPPTSPLQNMAWPNGETCVKGVILYDSETNSRFEYRHYFQRSLLDFEMGETSWLVVTRLDADTWEIEPRDAACNVVPAVPTAARVIKVDTKGTGTYTDMGVRAMPFRMTLRRK